MPLVGPPLETPVDIANLLAVGLAGAADEAALVSLEARWSWRELDRASEHLAGNLLALGLKRGDRVASLMPNRGDQLILYLACLRAGLVATPLNYRYMAPEIDHALGLSEASILVAHRERADDLAASALAGRLPRGRISYGDQDGAGPRLEALIERPPPAHDLVPPEPDDPAVIFFTSGSTGPPKGVTHSYRTLGWTLAGFAAAFEASREAVILPGASLSHGGGYKMSLAGLSVGAQLGVARSRDAGYMLPLLRQLRPSYLHMLPSDLFALVRDPTATRDDFASLRFATSAGDKVAGELGRAFAALTGVELREGYGLTETGTTAIAPPSLPAKPGSVGPPGPGFSLSLRDDDGTEVPSGRSGRLWAKSPCIMVGYWNDASATRAAFRDGWLDTGDVMRADEDGYLWFQGRRKQIIVHDGSNICPQDVEGALLEHPAVVGAGVIGIHDLLHGEDVRAYVALKPGVAAPSARDLIVFARARVGYKAPEEVLVLDEMPVTATGKIDRNALKRLAGAGKTVVGT